MRSTLPCPLARRLCFVRHDNFIPEPRLVRFHSRGRLPHWEVDEAVYFVTFRLRDSLPREVVRRLVDERKHLLRTVQSIEERINLDRSLSIRLDYDLDRSYGTCLLRDHAEGVANALKHFDGKRYQLHAWCVMPNHVHVMLYLERGEDLPRIVHSWKSYTAHQIGGGVIWEREYFDRVIRSPREFSDTRAYIHANPSKAGLTHWPWIG